MTSGVRDLIAGAGIELVERGRHTLKGVPGTWTVLAVATLEPSRRCRRCPRLRTASSGRTGNLPQPADPFVGRDDDLARLDGARRPLAARHPRGPGRRGEDAAGRRVRTEAAIGTAGSSTSAGSPTGEAVAAAFLDTLGVSPRTGVADGDRIVETLDVRSMLLVVDNCEHVLGATAQIVDRIARAAPDVRVLATSRQALGVDGEQVLVVAPLGLPRGGGDPRGAARGGRGPHVHRSGRAGRGDHRRPRQRRGPVPPARRHPARPRAGRLARPGVLAGADPRAARRRLVGVGGAARTARPERQVSLADAIDWSFRLLGDDERSLLLSLSTFRGAFDVAAASAVAGTDVMTTADRLLQLVDQSLVQSVPGRAGRRFRLLETVRSFTARRLDATLAAAARDRHAAYFAARVDELGERVPGPDEDDALGQLGVEFDDVQAAFDHAAAAGDVDTAARLANGPRLSLSIEGARWAHLAGRACSLPGHRGAPACGSPSWPARRGARCWWPTSAGPESSAAAGTDAGGRPRPATCACAGSRPQATGSSFTEGADTCLTGAAHAQEVGDAAGASFLLGTSAIYRLAAGDELAAIESARRALALAREIGSRSLRARSAGALAYALQDVDAAAARRAAEEVLDIADPGDFHLTLPHRVLAVLAWRDDDPDTAAEHATRAAYLIRDQGDRYVQAAGVRQLAVMVGPGRPHDLAAALLGVADALLPGDAGHRPGRGRRRAAARGPAATPWARRRSPI